MQKGTFENHVRTIRTKDNRMVETKLKDLKELSMRTKWA